MMDHRIKHLCCCNNIFSFSLCQLDHLFLNNGNVLKRHLNTHIASGNHDSVRHLKDFLEIIDSLSTLYLSYNLHVAVLGIKDFSYRKYIRCCPDKRSSYKIKALIAAELDIASVLFAKIWHRKLCSGHIDSLFIGNRSAVNNSTDNICIRHVINRKLNKTVIQKNCHSFFTVISELFVCNGNLVLGSLNIP